ncbi:RIP metalloprotease RseP [Brevibacillus sp. HB1.2]|uniref:Zinc metalloprotease n=1 Tax=Brevibacillus porteri TaxID=2126350 RepID=A0ABX5FLK5_9BACL|nr:MULTISPECIES: RIP metalloprotease RseP [Brevibacillus]ATF14139.1 RIP metalloprotease RseP [Brevibacillus brevis X23]MED1798346.1 RIP metalloprotease RseP [Brevibacillus porteri]MED2134284.1 RIP metalloprotease RseP [Brevibacillus porteri]MED2744586.1 RIP metalloprotease RseP [Brevibacillus porteri]MED2815269.1 RIP metalloprotease RseP [Brevibacillus porteri]
MPLPNLDSVESILAIVVVFGVLVFVHELGHFLLAKKAGILCREFALGMGPKIFRVKRGETEYTLRLLPIGGLVRMAGEDPEMDMLKPHMEVSVERDALGKVTHILLDGPSTGSPRAITGTVVHFDLEQNLNIVLELDGEQKTFAVHPQAQLVKDGQEVQIAPLNRQFKGKTVSQRFWAIFAGPAANFLLAFVLFIVIGFLYGVPNGSHLGNVIPGGPAAQAGLLPGDKVIAIQGQPVSSWKDVVEKISKAPDQQLTFDYERNGQRMTVPVKVGKDENNVGKIMVTNALTFAPGEVLKYGATSTYEFTMMILKSLGMLVTGEYGLKDLSGPVGIFKMTGEVAQQGMAILLKWAAVLSINLGLFNLLPLPALDGGRLAFLGVEALRGRPVDPHKEGMVHFLGFAFLMLLILVVTWNDLQRLFS